MDEDRLIALVVGLFIVAVFSSLTSCYHMSEVTKRKAFEKGLCQVVLPGSTSASWQKCQP